MSHEQITDAMVAAVKKSEPWSTFWGDDDAKAIISTSVKAYHEDDSKPITSEWLNSLPGAINVGDRQWLCSVSPDASLRIFLGRTSFVQVKFPDVSEAIHREIKTREEVFAWHVVLGRPLR